MRGKKAKALRRKVYGDYATRTVEYVTEAHSRRKPNKKTRIAVGFWRVYRDAKRLIKSGRDVIA